MPNPPRRLSEADTNFVLMGDATGAPAAPAIVSVYERQFDDPAVVEHLNEVMARLLPAMRQRIATDRLSTALPRWEDVPGFDANDHIVVLPAPGDGTLEAVLTWAEEWSRLPLPLDRPPWRAVYFEDVTVEGVPGRLVVVSQFHHAVIDGQGGVRLAEHFYQWGPEGQLPEMPPALPADTSRPFERWRAGWAQEGTKARGLLRNTAGRVRFAIADPKAAAARGRALKAAAERMQAMQGSAPLSPLLRRRSDRNRFDHLAVDLDALRAGARALGGSANDGLMAAVSLALHRWHLDHGVKVPEVRAAMPISTRSAEQDHSGNELVGVLLPLPLLEDATTAVKACQAVSRTFREDDDLLWLLDRFRAAANRAPKPILKHWLGGAMKGIDVSVSNVKGMPVRNWVAGVEILDTYPFLIGGPAVAATLLSGPERAILGVVTCPEAVPDPEHLMHRFAEGIAEVAALAP